VVIYVPSLYCCTRKGYVSVCSREVESSATKYYSAQLENLADVHPKHITLEALNGVFIHGHYWKSKACQAAPQWKVFAGRDLDEPVGLDHDIIRFLERLLRGA
jgi:hypothetical protein